jgi:hypothetical protein
LTIVASLTFVKKERRDMRLIAVTALKAAINGRNPPTGCLHHSDRGSL